MGVTISYRGSLADMERIEDFEDRVLDEGEYWETRDLAALRKKMAYVQSAIDGLADSLRQFGLTSEAAEDPEILLSRVTRVAQLVRDTLGRPN